MFIVKLKKNYWCPVKNKAIIQLLINKGEIR